MRLLLYDVGLDGHRAGYIKAIAAESSRRGWVPSVLLPSAAQNHPAVPALRELTGGDNLFFTGPCVPAPGGSTIGLIKHHVRHRRLAAQALRSLKRQCDFVYFPNLDYMDQAINLFGSPAGRTPMGGMCMRTRFHFRDLGIQAQVPARVSLMGLVSFRRLLRVRGIKCITTADPSLASYATSQTASEFRKVAYVPEIGMTQPGMDPSEAKMYWGFSKEDHVILVYGAISLRKGIPELLDAVRRLPEPQVRVLVVGHADPPSMELFNTPEIRSLIAEGRLRLETTYLDRASEAAAFAAADAVWVAYRNHSTMSGVFFQAVCAGVPVITANYGLLAWLAAREGVGISVDPGNAAATAGQIHALLTNREERGRYRDNTVRLARDHQPENFGQAVCNAIAASMT